MRSSWALAVLSSTLLGASYATPAPDAAAAAASGCPSAISLPAGGFESGKVSPWELDGNTDPSAKTSIVSPGYNKSKYALQADVDASSGAQYSISTDSKGKVCWGYYYNISYAWNWVNYSGPEGSADPNRYCYFQAITGYTDDNAPLHYATRKPGWHHHSYIARDLYSHCTSLITTAVMNVICQGANSSDILPAFSIQMDDFTIANAPGSPTPTPSPVNC